jgi:hypothetical protein
MARSLIRCDVASDSHVSKVGACTYCLGLSHPGKLIHTCKVRKGWMEPQLKGGDSNLGFFFGVIAFLSSNRGACIVTRRGAMWFRPLDLAKCPDRRVLAHMETAQPG